MSHVFLDGCWVQLESTGKVDYMLHANGSVYWRTISAPNFVSVFGEVLRSPTKTTTFSSPVSKISVGGSSLVCIFNDKKSITSFVEPEDTDGANNNMIRRRTFHADDILQDSVFVDAKISDKAILYLLEVKKKEDVEDVVADKSLRVKLFDGDEEKNEEESSDDEESFADAKEQEDDEESSSSASSDDNIMNQVD
jgi:hypothetical protein